MHILITGGAGFIGSHTAQALLAAGHRVRILDSLDPDVHPDGHPSTPRHPDVDFHQGDCTNPDAVAQALVGIDAIYHFAAKTGVGQSMYEMGRYTHHNVTALGVLLDAVAARRGQIQKMVLSSSRAIYGEGAYNCPQCGPVVPQSRTEATLRQGQWELVCPTCATTLHHQPTPESWPAVPGSVYGLTKQFQEALASQACQVYGIPLVILRYFNVYGPHQSLSNPYTGVAAIFSTRLLSGKPISLYEDGAAIRDFVHVRDVVHANLLALHHPGGGVFNIGTGTPHTIGDIALTIATALAQRDRIQHTGEFRVGDIRHCYADLTHSQRILGYAPHVSLADGITELVAWVATQHVHDSYDRARAELAAHGLM